MHDAIDIILDAFRQRGAARYGEEPVTQLQHALQCADLAVRSGAAAPLISAALLHDIGHILGDDALPDDCRGDLDDHHELKGYEFLKRFFDGAVTEPVRLHVAAKRYLCTKRPEYEGELSATSRKSYADQGGPMDTAEVAEFESEPHFESSVSLRQWDDAAKDPQAKTPPLRQYTVYLEASRLAE